MALALERETDAFTASARARPFVRRQVAAGPAVDDDAVLVDGREVRPPREIAVVHLEADTEGLEGAAAGVLRVRVVAEDREHRDVGLRSDALAHGDDGARSPLAREGVEIRRLGGLQRGAAVEIRMRLVTEPVEDDVEDLLHVRSGSVPHDHRESLRIERRAADKRTVDLGLRHQLGDVPRAHAPAVLDTNALRDGIR